jgi:hypothetical protein
MNEMINLWWVVITVLVLISCLSLCFPVLLIKLTRVSARQFDLQADRLLDKSITVDHLLYRHHVMAGALILLLSAATLYLLIVALDLSPAFLAAGVNPFGWPAWLFEAVLTATLAVSVIGCCFGPVLMLRPSLLKPLESWGNRWVTMPTELLDRDLSGAAIENWAIRHTRVFGVLVFLAALVIYLLVFVGF